MGDSALEDLVAWQKARELTLGTYGLTCSEPFARGRGPAGQMRRAAAAVVTTIAEGFEQPSSADFTRYVVIARGFCGGSARRPHA